MNRYLTLRNTDITIVDRVGHYVFTLSLYDLYGKPYDYVRKIENFSVYSILKDTGIFRVKHKFNHL